ncbi:hypothetical protein TWF225_002768 [Orbilia oligospora]|nr:hypothetical protein TWF225_002768 [Orbilia oligospora]KAF3238016.1 hypothetical protein TWF217_001810 [Orbilia oligospora]KAF3253751.1 hypothetical protein TWF128_006373 [Orbilia oligospora]KAF3297884.1 hypothetical protein TWF132_004033 [Orbilia oligospora]
MHSSYLLGFHFIFLCLFFNPLPSSAGPLDIPSRVTSEPPQPITHKLDRRPFWGVSSNLETGYLIHCDEPRVVFDNGPKRVGSHPAELRDSLTNRRLISGIYEFGWSDDMEDDIRWESSRCGQCYCDIGAEADEIFTVGTGPGNDCDRDRLNLCKWFFGKTMCTIERKLSSTYPKSGYCTAHLVQVDDGPIFDANNNTGCYCTLTGAPDPKGTDISLWDYFDQWEKNNNEKLPFRWRNRRSRRGPLPPGPFDPGYNHNSDTRNRQPFKQLVPGTKEPYYLEGPSLEDPTNPREKGNSDLDSLWRLNKAGSGGLWKRDDVRRKNEGREARR